MMKAKTQSWAERKKNLPKNWCEIVAKSLSDNGFAITPEKVSDVRAGKIADLETNEKVWGEITKLERRQQRKRMKLQSLISN